MKIDFFFSSDFTNASNALANRKALVEQVQAKIEKGKLNYSFYILFNF